jgi:choline dehydrogenase
MAPPVITSGYLGTDRDRRTLRDGVRLAIDLITCTGGTPLDPALATDLDDHELDIWIRNHLGTALHLCGTARMGSPDDPLAVTDGTGQVHGVTGLWVADLSLLPAVPRRGPAATAVMMGELLASTMLA